jgi:hypothetical protein
LTEAAVQVMLLKLKALGKGLPKLKALVNVD